MIQANGLTKFYGDRPAIRDVTFEVKKGEILGFLGPNGAGKTTTMRIITGFLPPTSGSATVAGFDVFTNPLEVKRRVGYMPENPPVYNEMVVSTYLYFAARIKGVPKNRLKQVCKDGPVFEIDDLIACIKSPRSIIISFSFSISVATAA